MSLRRRVVAPCRRARAFTLVELLVVIGIIAIVISLLFPALQRAKHKAQVLASPVAYVGTDNRLHLTDPTGAMEMPLTKAVAMGQCPVCHAPPAWSPSGLSVAFRMMEGGDITAVLEPFSGRVRKLPATGGVLLTWIDSNTVVQGQRSNFQVVDVHTGRPMPLRGAATADSIMSVSPAPAGAPGPYIGSVIRGGRPSVAFLKKDLSAARPIWTGQSTLAVSYPRVDPMAEYVAWTDQTSNRRVAIKHVNEPPSKPPSYITLPGYQGVYFCDWTEQGTMLGNATRDGRNWTLVLFDRDGTFIRRLETSIPPSQGVIASWRKYGHR